MVTATCRCRSAGPLPAHDDFEIVPVLLGSTVGCEWMLLCIVKQRFVDLWFRLLCCRSVLDRP